MPDDDLDGADVELMPGEQAPPREVPLLRDGTKVSQLDRVLHRDALPDFARTQIVHHPPRTAHMVEVAMCERKPVEPPLPRRPHGRRHNATANIKRACRRAPGIHKQRPPIRRLNQRRIPLPHIQHRHPQPPTFRT